MLELVEIQKNYEGKPLLQGVSFKVSDAETICLLGPSGSGKSTLLRIIAGLETADQGKVIWNGQDILNTPVHQRNFGLVFQDYALFPHKSVKENVAFGLEMQKLPKMEIDRRVLSALAQVNLTGFESRRVTDLSGGEQQRVALARALAPAPNLLMFDEPLGALDRSLKEHLSAELRGILHQSQVPAIYVTHDQEEAFAIADSVLLLHDGQIVQSGPPAEVYNHPANQWVAEFLGLGNILTGEVHFTGPNLVAHTSIGDFPLSCTHTHRNGAKVSLLLRPIGAVETSEVEYGSVKGIVADVLFHQSRFKTTLDNGLYFFLPATPTIGEQVTLHTGDIECLG